MKTITLSNVRNKQQLLIKDDLTEVASPKMFTICEVDAYTASILNEKWHSKLPHIPPSNIIRTKNNVNYVLRFNNDSYGIAIWTDPIAGNRFRNALEILELRRLALSSFCPHNTASWMISRMCKMIHCRFPTIKRLVSYQDTDVHLGTIYKASNWEPVCTTRYVSWMATRKDRNNSQSTATKIRWEYTI